MRYVPPALPVQRPARLAGHRASIHGTCIVSTLSVTPRVRLPGQPVFRLPNVEKLLLTRPDRGEFTRQFDDSLRPRRGHEYPGAAPFARPDGSVSPVLSPPSFGLQSGIAAPPLRSFRLPRAHAPGARAPADGGDIHAFDAADADASRVLDGEQSSAGAQRISHPFAEHRARRSSLPERQGRRHPSASLLAEGNPSDIVLLEKKVLDTMTETERDLPAIR